MSTSFAHTAVVVCEVPGNPVESGAIAFHAETTCSPASTSVLFTFSVDTADRARSPSLQITADRISSMTRTVHDHTTQLIDSPPRLDLVRKQLGSTRNLTRLHFELRTYGALASPAEVVSGPQNSGAEIITLLASTSVFSVYMPHDALQKATYNIFYRAVRPFIHTAATPQGPELLHAGSPPKYENEGRTLLSHESDNDTVAVTTPSGYGPPDDDEEELPGYPDSESEHSGSASKGTIISYFILMS